MIAKGIESIEEYFQALKLKCTARSELKSTARLWQAKQKAGACTSAASLWQYWYKKLERVQLNLDS